MLKNFFAQRQAMADKDTRIGILVREVEVLRETITKLNSDKIDLNDALQGEKEKAERIAGRLLGARTALDEVTFENLAAAEQFEGTEFSGAETLGEAITRVLAALTAARAELAELKAARLKGNANLKQNRRANGDGGSSFDDLAAGVN